MPRRMFKPNDKVVCTNIDGEENIHDVGRTYTIISIDDHALWPIEAIDDRSDELCSFNPSELRLAE